MAKGVIVARLEVVEGIDNAIELMLYRSKKEMAEGEFMTGIELTNKQISELVVHYGIKPGVVDQNGRQPI